MGSIDKQYSEATDESKPSKITTADDDQTQSSYSPQDQPLQAPMRATEYAGKHADCPRNVIPSSSNGRRGGGVVDRFSSVFKGKEPDTATSKRPSIEAASERRTSFFERIEQTGKDGKDDFSCHYPMGVALTLVYIVLRRSSAMAPNTSAIIDKLADTLNSWSPGIDEPPPAPGERRSWSERAFSFLFHTNGTTTSSSSAAAPYQKQKSETQEGKSQSDIEVYTSDDLYDDVQRSFRTEHATAASSSRQYPPGSSIRMQPMTRRPGEKKAIHRAEVIHDRPWSSSQPTDPRAAARRRSLQNAKPSFRSSRRSDDDDEEQRSWFNSDPESGRVAVPPLSVPGGGEPSSAVRLDSQSRNRRVITDSLHLRPSVARDRHEDQNVALVKKRRRPRQPGEPRNEKLGQFDSDFENWHHLPPSEDNTGRRYSQEAPSAHGLASKSIYMDDQPSFFCDTWKAETDVLGRSI